MMKVTMNVSLLFGFVIAISFLQLAAVQAEPATLKNATFVGF
jgi:hypothetical protein